jgi:ATP-dependent DNA ligase
MLYVDQTRGFGPELFRCACQLDLEGIIARVLSSYEVDTLSPHWIKIKDPAYSQKEGRADLFKRVG